MILSSNIFPLISGYSIIEQIYSSSQTIVYRGVRGKDQKPVIIKLMGIKHPTSQQIVQFRHQHIITQNLDLPGIIKSYSLEKYGTSYAFVMEDFGGISLADEMDNWNYQKIRQKPNFISYFLDIAIKIASALEQLRSHNIIHKDIKPDNILINPITKQVKITDFSIASVLSKEIQFLTNPGIIEGTLAYISPEQTGRMNRGIDYRSDYYSLGVTYFELLTGELPFNHQNPLDLIYSHISKHPPIEKIISSKASEIISNIICKLMAKNAEDRYQSALGLKHDLELCLNNLLNNQENHKTIETFELATKDISDNFIIPEKLYGREVEVQKLLAAFDRVINHPQHHLEKSEIVKGVEMVLVKGDSGMGKTAVVNEIYKPVIREKGYFIQGKFHQLQQNIPFLGWVKALENLIEQLLSENDSEIKQWKAAILSTLGEQAQVIINLIPALELIIGPQPKAAELSGIAAQNRLNFLFHKFIQIFAIKKHPLVIFLDDLQWADAASLSFIQLLMSENNIVNNLQKQPNNLGIQIPSFTSANQNQNDHALLLIGSYRDNEVSITHPLDFTIGEIAKTSVKITSINLEPLDQNDIGILIAETLKCEVDSVIVLTQAIFAKTKGNPFFIHQFLKTLYKDKAIKFNHEIGHWQCNIADVRKLALTDDVVEFLALQIKRLPTYNQKILKFAACIGNKFDLQTLSKINETHPNDTITELWDSVIEGLILPIDRKKDSSNQDHPTTALIIDDNRDNQISLGHCRASQFKFIHDRVQQAAYSLIPQSEKQQIHLKIGELLLNKTSATSWEKDIFEIVNQFNKALELIDVQQERNELAKMNLIAGRSAILSTAYQEALKYLNVGRELLVSNCWETEYELTLGLYEALAEVTYLIGDFQASEEFIEVVLTQAKTLLEKVKVYEIKIQVYTSQNKLVKAISIAREILKEFGVTFPEQPTQEDIQKELKETAAIIGDKSIEELANLPSITDTTQLAIMRIASSMIPPTYIADQRLFPLIVLSQVNLSVQYGNSYLSAFYYGNYGILLNSIMDDIETADKFGKLALNLLEKSDDKNIKTRTFYVIGAFIIHRKSHIKETLPLLLDAYQTGLEIGSLDFVGYCAKEICQHSYFMGQELTIIEQQTKNYIEILETFKQSTTSKCCKIFRQSIINFQSKNENPGILSGEAYNENQSIASMIEAKDISGLHYLYLHKLILCYSFEAYEQAQENANQAKIYLAGGAGFISIPNFHFYESLTALALYSQQESKQENLLNLVEANQIKLKKWAYYAPMNYLHKFYLVEAELYRVTDQYLEAIDSYELAITKAKENEYIHEEALANELAAKFYLKWGKQKIAKAYLDDAYYGYIRWGAKAKAKDLQKRYPQFISHILLHKETDSHADQKSSLSEITLLPEISNRKNFSGSKTSISAYLDLESVIKASQALSEQIKLDDLLSTLMEVIMQNAGASKSALILSKNANLDLEITAISCNSHTSSISTELPSIPLESSNNLPIRLINYVRRTKETIVIDDANTQKFLTADSYMISEEPKSILCIPIINQGKFFGILYLENKLTAGVFTRNRIKLLNLITNQAAISLKNAILYNNLVEAKEDLENYNQTLEEKVAQRTQEISEKNQTLKKALQDLQNTQSHLIQTEKMSSLGQMVAGIAHEINNPVNFIHGNINYANQYVQDLLDLIAIYQQQDINSNSIVAKKSSEIDLDFIVKDLPKLLSSIEIGTSRIRTIVLGLRNFSRLDEAEMKTVDIHQGIENTLMILQHRFKAKDSRPEIQVIKEYGQLPQITCYPGQLNQVFMNILSNAIDALEESQIKRQTNENSTIRIVTEIITSNTVRIRISDNGSGIEQKVRQKIFDPFFTTKSVGSGTGLGLSISYQIIVDKHKGQLICNSTVGEGTEFIIEIPIR
ncbi:MAG: AAA family ATPase [Rivularia sp. (in: cyanobacteria)]